MLSSRVVQVIRQFSKTAPVRKVHDVHEYNGPGSTLPFNVYKKYRFTLYFTIFLASGYALPFLMVRYVRMRSG